MTKNEKQEIGRARAKRDFEKIKTWESLQFATRFEITDATSGKYSKPYTLKLYNDNAEKYKNRPIHTSSCGFSNIENDAYIYELRFLLTTLFIFK